MSTVTIKDIARMAEVSIATVSRTLNGGRGVSPRPAPGSWSFATSTDTGPICWPGASAPAARGSSAA